MDTFEKAAQKMVDVESEIDRARRFPVRSATPPQSLDAKYAEQDPEGALSDMSDDDLLAEWEKATRALRERTPKYGFEPARTDGEPLAGTSDARQLASMQQDGSAVYPLWASDGKLTETPFSGMSRDLHRMQGTPEYQRVKDLHGPARIAYHRKNNLDINTGKPK